MKTTHQRAHASRRGSALALSLMIVTIVALLSAMMLQLSSAHWRREAGAVDQKRAFYIAEAGLSEAIYGLLQGNSGIVGTQELPVRFGDGVFWTQAESDAQDIVHIESTALCGQARAKLAIAIELYYDNALNLGAFSGRNMTIGAGAYIDAYNSKNGPYSAPLPGAMLYRATVGSNGDVSVGGLRGLVPTTILGNVTPGPDKSVSVALGGNVVGNTSPRADSVELPLITIPAASWFGPMTVSPAGTGLLPSGTYAGPNMTIGTNATGTIVGPAIVVVDSLHLAGSARLRVDSSVGPVEIYVRQAMTTTALSSIVNVTGDPRGLSLWLDMSTRTGGVLSFAHQGAFHGSIYAPRADVAIAANAPVYGSVVAGGLTLAPGAQFHIDVSAGDLGSTDMSLSVLHWRPVAVPREIAGDLRYEPLADFAARGVALPAPGAGHVPIDMAVEYTRDDGEVRTFRGTEETFDRSVVDAVIEEVVQPPVRTENRVGQRRSWTDIDDPVTAKLKPVKGKRGMGPRDDDDDDD